MKSPSYVPKWRWQAISVFGILQIAAGLTMNLKLFHERVAKFHLKGAIQLPM